MSSSTVLDRVDVWVEVNGRVVKHDEGGSLGPLSSKKEVELTVATEERAVAFKVNERSNAFEVPPVLERGHTCFAREILIKQGKPDFAGYPDNHLAIVVLQENGRLEMIKAGVTTQAGINYVVTHPTGWQPQIFRDSSDQLVCPVFERWGTLQKILFGGFAQYSAEFPRLPAEYVPPQETPRIPSGQNTGVVTWYEPFHGIGGNGAIRTAQGELRVRWREAPQRPGTAVRYLLKGEQVRYKRVAELSSSDEDEGQTKTKFKYDACGVSLAK